MPRTLRRDHRIRIRCYDMELRTTPSNDRVLKETPAWVPRQNNDRCRLETTMSSGFTVTTGRANLWEAVATTGACFRTRSLLGVVPALRLVDTHLLTKATQMIFLSNKKFLNILPHCKPKKAAGASINSSKPYASTDSFLVDIKNLKVQLDVR